MKAIHARSLHAVSKREMAAFDALPPELRDFIRTANQGWECSKLRRRLVKARTTRGAWWGVDRLIEQYRIEDAIPANIEKAA